MKSIARSGCELTRRQFANTAMPLIPLRFGPRLLAFLSIVSFVGAHIDNHLSPSSEPFGQGKPTQGSADLACYGAPSVLVARNCVLVFAEATQGDCRYDPQAIVVARTRLPRNATTNEPRMWSQPAVVAASPSVMSGQGGFRIDGQVMGAFRLGAVLAANTTLSSPTSGSITAVFVAFTVGNYHMFVASSHDDGLTFAQIRDVSGLRHWTELWVGFGPGAGVIAVSRRKQSSSAHTSALNQTLNETAPTQLISGYASEQELVLPAYGSRSWWPDRGRLSMCFSIRSVNGGLTWSRHDAIEGAVGCNENAMATLFASGPTRARAAWIRTQRGPLWGLWGLGAVWGVRTHSLSVDHGRRWHALGGNDALSDQAEWCGGGIASVARPTNASSSDVAVILATARNRDAGRWSHWYQRFAPPRCDGVSLWRRVLTVHRNENLNENLKDELDVGSGWHQLARQWEASQNETLPPRRHRVTNVGCRAVPSVSAFGDHDHHLSGRLAVAYCTYSGRVLYTELDVTHGPASIIRTAASHQKPVTSAWAERISTQVTQVAAVPWAADAAARFVGAIACLLVVAVMFGYAIAAIMSGIGYYCTVMLTPQCCRGTRAQSEEHSGETRTRPVLVAIPTPYQVPGNDIDIERPSRPGELTLSMKNISERDSPRSCCQLSLLICTLAATWLLRMTVFCITTVSLVVFAWSVTLNIAFVWDSIHRYGWYCMSTVAVGCVSIVLVFPGHVCRGTCT